MKRIIIIALILLVALPITAALSGMIDLGGGKNLLTGIASRALGRELRIDGDLELRLGGTPRIAARSIVLASPEWAAAELLRVEQFELQLNLVSLWRGPIRIQHLLIEGATADLVEREDGSNNWSFGEPTEDDAADEPGIRLPVVITEGQISNSLIRFMKPSLDSPAEFRINQLSTQLTAQDVLQLDLEGSVGDLPLQAQGRAGNYGALVSGEDIALAAEVQLADYYLGLEGRLGNLEQLENFDVKVQLTGPDSLPLYEALHFSQPDTGPVDLSASLSDLQAGMGWQLQGQFGSLVVDVTGAMTNPLKFDGLQLTFALSGDNLHLVASWLDVYTLPEEPFDLRGAVTRQGPLMEVNGLKLAVAKAVLHADATAPNFPGSRDIKIMAGIEGPSFARFREFLGLHGVIDVPFDLDVVVQARPGGLEILDSDLRVGGILLKLDGPLGDYPGLEGSELHFTFEGENLANLLAEADVHGGPKLPYRAAGILSTPSANKLEITESLVELAGLSIRVQGAIEDITEPDDSEFKVLIDTASLADSLEALGQSGFPARAASLSATLTGPLTAPILDSVELRIGDAWLKMEGKLQGFPSLDGSRASVRGEFPASVDWLPRQLLLPLKLSANLTGAEQQLWLDDLKVESPHWKLQGTAHVSDMKNQLGELQLSVAGPGLAGLLPPIEGFQFAATPFLLEANVARGQGALSINKLQLDVGDNRVSASGSLSGSAEDGLVLDAQGRSLASLGKLEQGLLPDLPYHLKGNLGRAGALWTVDNLGVRLGDDELRGKLSVLQQEHPRYMAALSSRNFNIGQFLGKLENAKEKEASDPQPTSSKKLLIPNNPLPLSWMSKFDADLDLDLAGLNIRDPNFPELTALASLRLKTSLEDGTLSTRQFELSGDRGMLSLPMTLQWRDDILDAHVAVLSQQIKLSILSSSYDAEGLPVQRVRSQFRAQGDSPRALASTVNGYLLLESGPGKMNNSGIDRVFDSFTTQLLETINPFFNKDPYTELECGVVGIEFDHGTALLNPGAIFRTSKMDIMTTGDIRLDTEALHLSFATKARKGLGISAASLVTPFLEVTGTLAKPEIGIDKKNAAVTGGAAAATGGLSIIASSLWNRYMNKTDPCQQASEKAQARLDETEAEAAIP